MTGQAGYPTPLTRPVVEERIDDGTGDDVAERRKPLQPLPAELPEPVRRFTEQIRLLYERVGSTLARLGRDLNVSDSSLSRYLNAQTPMPVDVLDRLCELAGVPSGDRERLRDLREAALAARAASPGEVRPENGDRAASETGAEDEPAPGGTVRRRRGRLLAVVAVAAVALGAAAAAVIVAVTGDDRPPPTRTAVRQGGCRQRPQYRVSHRGNVVDAHGAVVGTVWPGDLFTRDETPGNPARPYRYYGVVVKNGLAGYVLQERLTYYRAVCG
ncbi:helix-turn-helix domain-containing protein [Actinoallomurus rhizosphaericola]|uniref:helix-turn-helix domain-containing protein n=1 Tax=Actinoallomurus rhizosphaericola TaxID=2952536 RepID=UPI002091EDFB|nr:helix-turn-helix transcriptional regulator [Actinoallomurus rhizosphaericola]MCO5995952.1 helix-turn-helix domain-containing protein [Actinoallomurus rhizosphaericola]